MIPDVIATTAASKFCIEVTVTNAVDDKRQAALREVGVPALEIDLRRASGEVSRQELRRLVVDDVSCKRWIFHPLQEEHYDRLVQDYEAEVGYLLRCDRAELVKLARERAIEFYDANYSQELQVGLLTVLERLVEAGVEGCSDPEFWSHRNILCHLLSIQLDRPVGYNFGTTFEVINAITCMRGYALKYVTLYLIAIKVYQPQFSPKQLQLLEDWRSDIRKRVSAGNSDVMRPPDFDTAVACLFPEMAGAVMKPFGRVGRTDSRSSRSPTREALNAAAVEVDAPAGRWAAKIEGHYYSEEELNQYNRDRLQGTSGSEEA